ncbi:MAG: HAD family hydrolase [Deltaproteobacteria bacterium]|nr:HAD family hydrolase [Deltaproteobacteria bacterium]MBW2660954.1 HAD family hydrolase [Deltaproteobacteria bacterium]
MLNKELVSKYITLLHPIPTSLKRSGNLKEKIKCILFDIYGTLFISGSGDIGVAKKELQKAEKIEPLLQKYRIIKTPEAVLKDLFIAIENKHNLIKKNGIDFPEVEIDRIWMGVLENNNPDTVRKFAIEYELITNPVYPMPNLKELIAECTKKKVLMGIISNAQFYTSYLFNWFLNSELEDLGFNPDLCFFSYRLGRAKPSPFMFKIAFEKLKEIGVSADSTLYAGNDMLNDIYPAKQAGFKTALFAGDARSLRLRKDASKCKNLRADLVITDLIQLLEFI